MVFLVVASCIWTDFVNFLYRLSLLDGRRRVPNIRVFEYFIIIVVLAVLFVTICAEAAIGRSKIVRVSDSKAIIVLIDGVIFIGQRFFLRFDDSTSIKSDTSEHGLDILHTIFFLYNLSLKNPPVLYNLLGDIIQNDLLLDGVNYFFVLLDRVVIFTQISEISSIFQILLYLLYFCLHWDIWVIIILLIMSQIQAIMIMGSREH